MSKTLNLIDILLRRARTCHELGLHDQAKDLFERLATYRSLPAEVAEETQLRLAELCEAEDDSFKERQHLTCALAQQPNNPEYHYRLAKAYGADSEAHDAKALPHLKAAIRIDPENARYLAEFGCVSIRLGQTEQGLRQLKKAHHLDGDDLGVLEQYADALVDADQSDEARTVLKTAMFRHSSDRRYRDLFRDFQFRLVADDQKSKATIPFPDDEPVLLPFVKTNVKPRRFAIDGQIVRLDGAEPLHGPSKRTPSRKKHTR
jgi:tetratricopeptide (TPR) repeat protein